MSPSEHEELPVEEVSSKKWAGDDAAASSTSAPSAPSQPAPVSEPVDKAPSKMGGEDQAAGLATPAPKPTNEPPQETKLDIAAYLTAEFFPHLDLVSDDGEYLGQEVAAWMQEFIGPGEKLLRKILEEAERHFRENRRDETGYHSKILPIIQSAGCGKSRLLAEYGKHRVGVIYYLKEDQFPVQDTDVAGFIEYYVECEKDSEKYAGVIALFGATIETGE